MGKYVVNLQGIFNTDVVVKASSEKRAMEKAEKILKVQMEAIEDFVIEEIEVEVDYRHD